MAVPCPHVFADAQGIDAARAHLEKAFRAQGEISSVSSSENVHGDREVCVKGAGFVVKNVLGGVRTLVLW